MGTHGSIDAKRSWELLAQADTAHFAGVVDGQPVLRVLNCAVLDETLVVHGGPGQKAELVGRRVVASASADVVRIASWMVDPERACPATTLFWSVQVEGRLVEIEDPLHKARCLAALMAHLQPEGRHRPLELDSAAGRALYRKGVAATRVWALHPDRVTGREKLSQHKSRRWVERVLHGLWTRGAPGDLAAMERIRDAHPDQPRLPHEPDGLRLRVHPSPADAADAAILVTDTYWNLGRTPLQLADAVRHSSAWVGLEDHGRLVATARAISDRVKRGWIYDVAVAPSHQRRGIGRHLFRALLDHPAVRDVESWLQTRDAMGFYAQHGFTEHQRVDGRSLMRRDAHSSASPASRAVR